LVNQDTIDYTTSDGIKLWKAGIEPLQKEPFTLEAHSFKVFLTSLADQAITCSWGNILNVPNNVAVPAGPTQSILMHYGQVTLDQVRAHATAYINAKTHMSQNNLMLYTCLATSVALEVKARAIIYSQDYHIGQNPSGVTFLKILIWEVHIDTRATIMHIRAKLSALNTYILTIRCDITKFNAYIKDLLNSLTARGNHSGPPGQPLQGIQGSI